MAKTVNLGNMKSIRNLLQVVNAGDGEKLLNYNVPADFTLSGSGFQVVGPPPQKPGVERRSYQ